MNIKKLIIVFLIGIAIVGGGFALYRLGDVAPALKNKKPAMAHLPQAVQLENVDKKVNDLRVITQPAPENSNTSSRPVLQSNVSSKTQSVAKPTPSAPQTESNSQSVTGVVSNLVQPVTSTLQNATNYTNDLLDNPLGL